ncbi:phosphoribosyltransferase [Sulfuriflexus mobilis]|uniref:phosphoribosyltransferase n=1 Tax=Sulfuriflexus mobilis TaxID=1811807 RepID=UPI000F82E15F|nr:phosphoribosyltransferase [Sulfuriflexus mobilis]
MQAAFKVEFVSWGKISNLVHTLANRIHASGYRPDIVVAIARGGYVPARLLCDHLDIYNLTSMRISHYTSGAEKGEAARLSMPLNTDIRGLRVLLVDDVGDTGNTLQLALEHINALHPAEIKIAVLHHKHISQVVPDFYAQKIISWRWLTYPWAIIEDVRGFIRKMEPQPATAEEALQRLKSEYGLKLPLRIMQDVYR